MKNFLNIKYIPLLFLLLLSCTNEEATPAAHDGIINLKNYTFDDSHTLPLNGKWKFYYKQLLTSEEITRHDKTDFMLATVPFSWNSYKKDNKKLPAFGCGTFKLRIELPEKHPRLALKFKEIHTAAKVFVDNIEIFSAGTVSETENSIPSYKSDIFYLPENIKDFDLIIQVSNFDFMIGGIIRPIELGTVRGAVYRQNNAISISSFVFGIYIIFFLYYFGLFILRRENRVSLFFGLFCFCVGIRYISTGEMLILHYYPGIDWEILIKIQYLSYYIGVPLSFYYIKNLFPEEMPVYAPALYAIIELILSLIVIFTPSSFYSVYTSLFFELITSVVLIITTGVVIKAFLHKREGAIIFLAGMAIIIVSFINDVLNTNSIISSFYLFPYGMLIFIFLQSFLLSKIFTNAFGTIEKLSIEISRKNEDLIRIDKMKDDFLAATSHELRTPLHGILGISQSLMEGVAGDLTDFTKHNISIITSSGQRLLMLVNNLLDVTKLQHKDLKLSFQMLDISSVANTVINILMPLAQKKNISLTQSFPGNLPLINADENRMQQILINIVENAIKFTDSGAVTITGAYLESSHAVEISVTDNGCGIPEEHFQMIFDPFFQGSRTEAQNIHGTGLGLSIAKELISLHNGEISVESTIGAGSVFRILIPVTADTSSVSAGSKNIPERINFFNIDEKLILPVYKKNSDNSGFPNLLIVDDDPVNIQVLVNFINSQNFNITTASNGDEVLEKIRSGLIPDLILLDIMLPRISGFEITKIIRINYSLIELPIIMLTAKNQPRDVITGFQCGANDYLIKPFDKSELLARVNTLITMKNAVSENHKFDEIKSELAIAKNIHESTLPTYIPEIPGLDISALYIPMNEIGGDYYNFHQVSETKVGVLIADVTGHGIPAALVASMVKIVFKILAENAGRPDIFLTQLNRILTDNVEERFITAGYIYLDLDERTVSYSRAGHEPLLIFNKYTNEFKSILPSGRLLGVMKELEYSMETRSIEKGDRLILYTDCITESTNSNKVMFGDSAFHNFIKEQSGQSSRQFIDLLKTELSAWTGMKESFGDDLTIIVIDVL